MRHATWISVNLKKRKKKHFHWKLPWNGRFEENAPKNHTKIPIFIKWGFYQVNVVIYTIVAVFSRSLFMRASKNSNFNYEYQSHEHKYFIFPSYNTHDAHIDGEQRRQKIENEWKEVKKQSLIYCMYWEVLGPKLRTYAVSTSTSYSSFVVCIATTNK